MFVEKKGNYMLFETEEITLKDGRKCLLKCAGKEDALGMVIYVMHLIKIR